MKSTNSKIHIDSKIESDGDAVGMELVTDALFARKNDSYYVMYAEPESSELYGCVTTVKVKGERVMIRRTGAVKTTMEYEQGKDNTSVYAFTFGSIVIENHTRYLNINIGDDGGEIELHYTMDMGGEKSENKMKIRIVCDKTIMATEGMVTNEN